MASATPLPASPNRKIAFVASLAAMALGATPAHAGTDAPEDTGADIVVTGTPAPAIGTKVATPRIAGDQHDIAQSVTVLDKELLGAQGATSLADALRNVPGITLGGAEGGQIGNNINLNGFTARTDIFLDGFRDRGQYYRDTFALDSVEVLMGPSSMLFGRGSTGGAINQVPHQATLKPGAQIATSVNTNGMVRGTAGIDQPLSSTAALRVDGMWQDGAPTTRTAMTNRDYGFAPTLRMGIGTPTEVTVSGLVQHNRDRPDYGVSPLNGAPVSVPRNTVYGYDTDRTIQDVTAGSAAITHHFSPQVSLRNQVQYNAVTTDAVETAANTIGTIGSNGFAVLTPAATSSLPLAMLGVRLQSHDRVIHDTSLFDQAELKVEFGTGPLRHTLLVGSELGRDTYRNQLYYRNGACNGVALNAPGAITGYVGCVALLDPGYGDSPAAVAEAPGNYATGRADTLGVYANDTLALGERLKLVGGLRWDSYAATITNSINLANTPGNTTLPYARQTVHYTSVRAGAIWQPTRALSTYASFSTSFDPALEQLTSTTGISAPLPPETNHAYELGGKWDLAHDRLHLNAAAFQITQFNSRSQNSDNTYTANGTVRVRGVRLGADGEIVHGWKVFAGYSHLDARIVQAIAVGTQGKVPINTPRDAAMVWSTLDLDRHWQIGGGATTMGKRYANNTDTVAVGSYLRTDATIAWRQPRYDLRVNVFNLANVHYSDALIASDGGRAVPGTGRTALFTFAWHM